MSRLRRLFHRHRWATLAVTLGHARLGDVVITARACWCGERTTTKGE